MAVEFDEKKLQRARDLLQSIPGGFEKALNLSINRAISSTNAHIKKIVMRETTLKGKYVRPDTRITKSTVQTLSGELRLSGYRQPLAHYKFSPQSDTTRTHKPVRVEEIRGQSRIIPRGFVWEDDKIMQRVKESHAGERRSRWGLPIRKLTGPAVAQIVGQDERMAEAEKHMTDTLEKRLDHSVTALLEGWIK